MRGWKRIAVRAVRRGGCAIWTREPREETDLHCANSDTRDFDMMKN